MDFLVEGNDVLSKDQLLKIKAGTVGCDDHCKLKIIICWIVCKTDSSVINQDT